MTRTPALENLVAGYLNPDWPDIFGDVWAALEAFIEGQVDERVEIVPEISSVLDAYPSEGATRAHLEELGCGYRADWDGGTYRGWLEEVARRVTAALAAQGD